MSEQSHRKVKDFLVAYYKSDRYKASQKWLQDLVQKNRERMYTKHVPTKE